MGNATSRRPQQQQQQASSSQQPSTQTGVGPGGAGGATYPPAQQQQAYTHAYSNGPGAPNAFHPGYRPQQPGQPPLPPPPFAPQGSNAVNMPQSQQLTKTATIRNSVNLKKSTLRLAPVPGDAQRLQISFTFDNSAPCRVSTFVAATEEPSEGSRISSASMPWAPPICYEKGLGLTFPAACAPDHLSHTVDLRRHTEEVLLADNNSNSFALIIRLETITERGLKEGHTLKDLKHGGAQESWVQSQTTFAALAHGEVDGDWEARVLKQKIWVDGISYELQEIYGMEQATGGSSRPVGEMTDAESEDRLCVICLVNERDTTVLPCRHMCMCHECAQELRKQTQRCPICRNPVESLLHIRLGSKAKDKGNQSFASRSTKQSNSFTAPPVMRPAVENV